MDCIDYYSSPIGRMILASGGEKLTGLWFDGQKHFASSLKETPINKSLPVFEETIRWLDIYFNGGIPDFIPPLSLLGTPFQKEVWEILLTIPYGKTMTYGEIAKMLADRRGLPRMSAQAVGGAIGRNPISIIVPCHRVLGSNGELTGYAGGIDKKAWLLELERTK